MNARIDLAISAGLAERSLEPTSDEACECAYVRPGIKRQLVALFAPLATVHLKACQRTTPHRR